MVKQKSIEERYKKLDEIDHILLRSGMYVGSVKNETRQFFLWDADDESLTSREVEYCPALLKLIDEVISNSCDEYRRKENLGLTQVEVTLDDYTTEDGTRHCIFTCRDDGGIPVVMHKEAKMYVPEMIFSQLRTSSNYDDEESRTWIGTNGVGAKLTGVFSKFFQVETADGKNMFKKSWTDNMRTPDTQALTKRCKEHYTELTYEFDMSRFDDSIDGFTDDFCSIVEKRCIDAAAANPGLTVSFIIKNHEVDDYRTSWKFNAFTDYLKLFSSYVNTDDVITHETPDYSVYVFPDGSLTQGFVNGVACDRGTHIKVAQNAVNEFIADYIKTKKKQDIQPKEVTGKYSLFCCFSVVNPAFDSQTKENLTTPADKLFADDTKFTLPKKFLDQIAKSDIIDTILDWIKQRDEVLDQKKLRELNKEAKKKVVASEKYIPAHGTGNDKILCIFEGQSAASNFSDTRPSALIWGAYLLRGVTLQTLELTPSAIMKNKELSDLVRIIGLDWNDAHDIINPGEIREKVNKLNYKKIYALVDQDEDAFRILGILLAFFSKWPWLYRAGCIAKVNTPMMICTKGNNTVNIYSWTEYREKEKELNGYFIRYLKGLGSLKREELATALRTPKLQIFNLDEDYQMSLYKWFGKKHIKDRQNSLKENIMED